MSIIRYNPWSLFDLDEIFDYPSKVTEEENKLSHWMPSVDIKSEPKRYVVFVDVPGVEPNDIEVYVENNALIIKGERETETKESKEGYSRVERISGKFYRRFTLPDDANGEKILADTENGVLEIEIPKKEQTVLKRVSVKKKEKQKPEKAEKPKKTKKIKKTKKTKSKKAK